MIEARGVTRGHTLDGVAVVTAFDQLPGYRWAALVAMPRDEALGADKRTIVLVFTFGAALLTAAVLLALRMGRWIAQPVEIVAHAASEWVAGRPANFPTKTGMAEMDGLSRAFAAALRAVEERDERQRLLINELNHRVKNTLATVQAVALHTRSSASSIGDYHLSLEGRVIAMSRAHELLTRSAWECAELGELARETLSAFAGSQLRIHGPIAHVGPTDALNLALILYELATNAAKHGALSADGGHVELSWRRIADQTRVCWKESGGPPVAPPTRKGFGSRLITRATKDLQPSELNFAPSGLHCEFTLPTRAA
jgi:two-component sensor histidine kinase